MLETDVGFSARSVHALNCQVFSSSLRNTFLKYVGENIRQGPMGSEAVSAVVVRGYVMTALAFVWWEVTVYLCLSKGVSLLSQNIRSHSEMGNGLL